MLFSTSTTNNIFSQFGVISSSIFSSFSAWLYLVLGLLIAWYIIYKIYSLFKDFIEKEKKFEKQTKELIERGNKMTEAIKKYDK